jgi:CheY-like chemotaxis protein
MPADQTILMVEDSPDDVVLVQRTLVKLNFNYPLFVVPDAEQAIAYLAGDGKYADRTLYPYPRTLLADMTLPRRSALAILEWLRNHPECLIVPTIILSSSEDPEDITRAYQLGASAYMIKPVSLFELKDLLELTIKYWCSCAKPPYPMTC